MCGRRGGSATCVVGRGGGSGGGRGGGGGGGGRCAGTSVSGFPLRFLTSKRVSHSALCRRDQGNSLSLSLPAGCKLAKNKNKMFLGSGSVVRVCACVCLCMSGPGLLTYTHTHTSLEKDAHKSFSLPHHRRSPASSMNLLQVYKVITELFREPKKSRLYIEN